MKDLPEGDTSIGYTRYQVEFLTWGGDPTTEDLRDDDMCDRFEVR